MKPSGRRAALIAAPLPTAVTTAGTGAGTILLATVTELDLSGRRRRKREVEVGAEEGVGAAASRVGGVAIAAHPPTVEREKVGERGEGNEAEQLGIVVERSSFRGRRVPSFAARAATHVRQK